MTDITRDVEWARVLADLERSAAISRAVDEKVLAWLAPSAGSRVADIGCGAGGMSVLLADAVGPDGHVIAVDGESVLLNATIERARRAGLVDRVRPLEHDLSAGPAPLEGLDLVWAAHVVHHLPDQQAALNGLAAALDSTGRLALAEGGLASSCLPWDVGVGEPGLEDRLNAAVEAWFAAMRSDLPDVRRMPYGWAAAMALAGLTGVESRTFLLELSTPLDPTARAHAIQALTTRVERVHDRLPPADSAAWDRLLDPDDEMAIARRDDLHVLAAHTVHVGTRV